MSNIDDVKGIMGVKKCLGDYSINKQMIEIATKKGQKSLLIDKKWRKDIREFLYSKREKWCDSELGHCYCYGSKMTIEARPFMSGRESSDNQCVWIKTDYYGDEAKRIKAHVSLGVGYIILGGEEASGSITAAHRWCGGLPLPEGSQTLSPNEMEKVQRKLA